MDDSQIGLVLSLIAVVSMGALLANVYHICDRCHKFDWSVRFRLGTWERNSNRSKQLCDECYKKEKRR